MASCNSNRAVLLLFLALILFLGEDYGGHKTLSSPSLKLYNQRKYAKTHVIKTFQEDNGDIIDCIDVYKQPSLTHPLLKGHQVQLKPQNISQTKLVENSKNISIRIFLGMKKCPDGFVPIKRTSNEDLIIREYLNYSISSKLKNSQSLNSYDAMFTYPGKNQGASGYINVWGVPNVGNGQLSSASITIKDGPPDKLETVMAGWMVKPDLFGDRRTRLFIFWSDYGNQNSNCFNMICPGFVQVSSELYPGAFIEQLSVFEGPQYEIRVQISQDKEKGDWWLTINDKNVGYWPKSLFTHFQDGGTYASWGGHVLSPSNVPSPSMGSGMKPMYKNGGKVAYIRQVRLNYNGNYDRPGKEGHVEGAAERCYDIQYHYYEKAYWAPSVVFGGPGGCK